MEATHTDTTTILTSTQLLEPDSRLHFYLIQRFKVTRFPFFGIGELHILGLFDKDEANKLFKEGKIKVRQGVSGKIIELVVKEN